MVLSGSMQPAHGGQGHFDPGSDLMNWTSGAVGGGVF